MSARRFKAGQGLSAAKINQVVDSVNASEKVGLYGMTGQVSPAGRMLTPILGLSNPTVGAKAVSGAVRTLGSVFETIDSDSWSVVSGGTYIPVTGSSTSGSGVALLIPTDWWYDESALKFYARTRTQEVTKKGFVYSVGQESAQKELPGTVKKCSICSTGGAISISGSAQASNYISTLGSGTAPYATSSTTLNSNLNADLLDGLHSGAFLASGGTAADSSKLGGVLPAGYLAATGTAVDSGKLDGLHSSAFLASGGTAVNSDLLDSLHSSAFLASGGTAIDSSKLGGVLPAGYSVTGHAHSGVYLPTAAITGTTGTIPKFTSTSTIGDSVIVQSGSYIGIGTVSPVNVLSVVGTSNTVGAVQITAPNVTDAPWIDFNVAGVGIYGQITNSNGFRFKSQANVSMIPGSSSAFNIYRGGVGTGVPAFTVLDGYVGIGVAVPGVSLDVSGDVRTDDQLISTVTGATSPLAVTSTTVNTNLNSDLLDGLHSGAFLASGGTAVNSDLLDNLHSGAFLASGGTAADSSKLGGVLAAGYSATGHAHTTYVPYTGATGSLALGANTITTSATGVISNLNADLWDGYQFSSYLDQAVKTTSNPTFGGVVLPAGSSVSFDLAYIANAGSRGGLEVYTPDAGVDFLGDYIGVTTLTASVGIEAPSISCSPTISSGTAAPTSTPTKIGDLYVDTTNHKLYFSDSVATSGGWVAVA